MLFLWVLLDFIASETQDADLATSLPQSSGNFYNTTDIYRSTVKPLNLTTHGTNQKNNLKSRSTSGGCHLMEFCAELAG